MGNILHRFRIRLTVLFGGLALLSGLGTTLYINQVATTRLTADSGQELLDISRNIANALASNISEREREIFLLSRMPIFARGELGGADIRQILEMRKRTYRDYAWIGIADPAGQVRAAAGGILEGESVAQRPWFIRGRQGTYTGDVHEAVLLAKKLQADNPREPLRFIDFAAPVFDDKGQLRGVLASHAHWSWVTETIRRTLPEQAGDDGIEAFVVNARNEIIHPFAGIGRVHLPTLPTDGRYGVLAWGDEGNFLTGNAPVAIDGASNLGWRVVIRQPIARALAPVTELHRNLLLLGCAVTALFMLLAYRLAGSFSRPVEQLATAAHRVEQGEEETLFAEPGSILEIRELTHSLRAMTGTLFDRKRQLETANATLEQKVLQRTAELADLYNNAPVGYHTVAADGTVLQTNDRELELLGYERNEVEGRMQIADLFAPGSQASVAERMKRLQAGEFLPPQDIDMRRRDGSLLPVRISSSAVFDEGGRFRMVRTAVMDVAELRALEQQLHRQQALNQAIVHASSNGLLLYRSDGQCLLANEAAAKIVGSSVGALYGQNFHNIEHWKTCGLYEGALQALGGEQNQRLISSVSSFGKNIDCRMTCVPLQHEGDTMLLIVAEDVSELIAANRELEQLARRDTLTGLHNRLAANERLHEEFLRMKRSGSGYSVLLIDIDYFKRVNDCYGHAIGDQVLKEVATLLRQSARITDFVARFGGEEFLAVLPDTTHEGARVLAEKLRETVAGTPIPTVGQITLSIGLATADLAADHQDDAVRRADQQLYRAKAEGRNRVEC
jgi:diguanylate cyclase